MTGISPIFNEQVMETVKSQIRQAVKNGMVGNGVATGGGNAENWLETIASAAEDVGIPFEKIAPAPEHDSLKDLFNAHKQAILGHDGPCIVCFDASQNHDLVKDVDAYIALNDAIEELLFKNGKAIYVHVMAGDDEPNIFIASNDKPKAYGTTKLNF